MYQSSQIRNPSIVNTASSPWKECIKISNGKLSIWKAHHSTRFDQNRILCWKKSTPVQTQNSHHISSLLSKLYHCKVHTISDTLKKSSRAIRVHNWSLAKPGVRDMKAANNADDNKKVRSLVRQWSAIFCWLKSHAITFQVCHLECHGCLWIQDNSKSNKGQTLQEVVPTFLPAQQK